MSHLAKLRLKFGLPLSEKENVHKLHNISRLGTTRIRVQKLYYNFPLVVSSGAQSDALNFVLKFFLMILTNQSDARMG